jgi:ketosteroid isomerase-like protein
MTSTNDPRTVLEAYLEALTAGDLDRIANSFTEDATWSLHGTLPVSGTKHGREEIMEFLVSAGTLCEPDAVFTFGEILAEGDRAVLEWNKRGVGTATGKAYDNDYCGVFVVRDGRIAAVREYLDSLHAAEVLFG